MRIVIRATGFELTDGLRVRLDQRVRAALSRFTGRLSSVTVRIADRGRRSAGDGRFTCEVAMTPMRLSIVEEHERVETAIDRAIARAVRVAAPPRQ